MIPTPSPPRLPDETALPPFLRDCPTDLEDMPLQVQLLTMEVAALRLTLMRLAAMLETTASIVAPPTVPELDGPETPDG